MKKTIFIICFLFIVCSVFATDWSTIQLKDEFGDPTDSVRLYTFIFDVQYDTRYTWAVEDCAVLIDKGLDFCPYVPEFYLGNTIYDDWTIKVKFDDGSIVEYKGMLYGSYIYPKDYTIANALMSALLKGGKFVITPDNDVSTNRYNLGYIQITEEILSLAK